MIRTQIQLTEDQVKKLKKVAATRRQSMAEIVRKAVDNFMALKGGIDVEERQKKAIAAADRFHSEVKDLSEKHDKYLVEVFGK